MASAAAEPAPRNTAQIVIDRLIAHGIDTLYCLPGVQITASDGESRIIGAGEVILVEDISGKGHLSKSVGGKMRRSIFVPID